ncbi:MAG: DMT family transporter [Leeuwenhoekiella sp.]
MDSNTKKWVYLIILSLIWGSSYILIKKGLVGLTPLQLGATRIIFSTVFLFIIGFKSLFKITRTQWPWVAWSALFGTFIPVFLFAYAETEIDSSIASILNSLVPVFTIFIGFVAFKINFTKHQIIGVILGLIGAAGLIFQGASVNPEQDYFFSILVIIAALCYAANANILKSKLQDVSAKGIAVGNFAVMVIPAIICLAFSGLMDSNVLARPEVKESLWFIVVLSIVGTGVAKILFNKLVQISTPVFSTSVTYLIPVVGIFWGVMDAEPFTIVHFIASMIILAGVYLVNKKGNKKKRPVLNRPL